MKDIEIANSSVMKPIEDIAALLNVDEDYLEYYGKYKAKIKFNEIMHGRKGKLILVTAMNPTPYGEGKTTVSIGLVDGLRHINKNTIGVLREPSLGPVFGLKGGATGGGYSQVLPMEDINLHFTGDIHAITSANNLICSAIDNHLFHGNELLIDKDSITFKRCLDINDRALREITIHNTYERIEGFNITAASEIMSIICLSKDMFDLRTNLGNIIIGSNLNGVPIYVKDLNLVGSLLVLLKDAINPNLVQTIENNPVIIHGGPFANIAHGCNSIIATNLGMQLADYVVTEAGFGADLGAEKFFDIKCRKAGLEPDCIVLVATIRALKHHSGLSKKEIDLENPDAVSKGLANLEAHIDNIRKFTSHIVVALNRFDNDKESEIQVLKNYCSQKMVHFTINDSYRQGGIGSVGLANKVVEICDFENDLKLLYDEYIGITEKIETVCKEKYHAGSIFYSNEAMKQLEMINKLDLSVLPVCIAKTQYSISDNANLLGYPKGHEVTVKEIILNNGAGFITVLLGNIIRMPGAPKEANYELIDMDDEGNIIGLF